MFYVYQIVGPSGVYVGKTNDVARRWKQHVHVSKRGKEPSRLHRAMAKYGAEAFAVEVLAQCRSDQDVLSCECTIISQEREAGSCLYNLTDGGEGVAGLEFTSEHRERLRQAMRSSPRNAEVRKRNAEAQRGKKLSEEHKAALREGQKNKTPLTLQQKQEISRKISTGRKGIRHSVDTRARMSVARKGKKLGPMPEEQRRKIAAAREASWAKRHAEAAKSAA
jgi:group I intron endonuclease